MKSADLLNLILCVSYLGGLILIGKFLRVKVKLFQKLFLPASLIGGVIGLILGPSALKIVPESIMSIWRILPGNLINIVFACVFIGAVVPKLRDIWDCAGPQLTYAWIIDGFQWVIGLGIALFILKPIWGIDPLIGTIVEVGWAGGHGTAGGMGELYANLGFAEGGDLALTSATIGLLSGIIFGVALINIAVRKGYCEAIISPSHLKTLNLSGVLRPEEEKSVAKSVILSDSLEPFAFHACLIGLSIVLGSIMLYGIKMIHPKLSSVPLFPIAMIGGLIIQIVFRKFRADYMINRQSIERLQGLALDFLVAGAVASIKIPVVVAYAGPLVIMMGSVLAVMILSTWFLARIFFKDAWFERGIAEFGALTGVLAVGLLLLRIVDPDLKTNAPKAFAFERPLFSPFIGGGLVTSLMPIFVAEMGALKVIGLWIAIIAALFLLAFVCKWIHLPKSNKAQA